MKTSLEAFRRKGTPCGFTLIELLAVVTVIAVLTGITFGISKGVLNHQARAQARAELAMITQALEEFKLTYGDYPIISEDGDPTTESANAKNLTYALTGYGKQDLQDVTDTETGTTSKRYNFIQVKSGDAKRFVDPSRLNYSGNKGFVSPGIDGEGNLTSSYFLVDPWRQPYVYIYNKGNSSWDNIGYVLFSKGPDREAQLDSAVIDTGIIDQSHYSEDKNKDNVYPNH
jgi:prepilin-type N-terminal cleavage/methylation domain-containing protein